MAARSFLYGGDSGGAAAGGGSALNPALRTNKTVPYSSSKPLDSFFVSGSSPSFLGSRSMVSFDDRANGSVRPFFQAFDQEDIGDDEYDEYFHQPEKKRRLKADQVQFLEKSFETENKLEPERKIQLAKDLGLQPRQIAIWFQNRRARWKNKQLEKDYDVLQEKYNKLKENYENLIQEQEKLKSQVLDLSDKLILQENEKGATDSSSTKSVSEPLQQDKIIDYVNDEDVSKTSNLGNVQDDDIGVNSRSPRYALYPFLEQVDSSYVFEQDQSDESFNEEDNLGKMFGASVCGYTLPKTEIGEYPEPDAVNSCYLGFPVRDQDQEEGETFGFWSY